MYRRLVVAFVAALLGVGPALAQIAPPTAPAPVPGPAPAPPVAAPPPAVLEHGRSWVTADFLLGRINGPSSGTTLLTTSPPGTPQAQAGVLGLPTTTVLFGANAVDQNGFNEDVRLGFRLGAGRVISDDGTIALEGSFLMLASQATAFSASSDGTTILARPFTNATNGLQQSVLVGFPGLAAGTINFDVSSGNYYTATLGLAETFCDKGWLQLDSLLGYRFYRYDEGFRAVQSVTPLDPNFIPGSNVLTRDEVTAKNEFHGAEVGLRARVHFDDFTLSLLAKCAGGNLRRVIDLNGSQVVTVPGQPVATSPAGFLVLGSNAGRRISDDATVVPEFGASLSWRASSALRLRVGYSLTILTQAASAARQLDSTLNPALFPPAVRDPVGGDRPVFVTVKDDILVQTLQFGAELNW